MFLHVCTHFLVKRDEQCVLKRLINDTYLLEMYSIFNSFIPLFILNSPWSYIWWLGAYISVLLPYIYMTSLSHFHIFLSFFPIIEKGNGKGHVSFFVFGVVLMWKILNAFNALLQGAALTGCCKWGNRVYKTKLKSTYVPCGQLSYWYLQNLE